MLQYGPQDFFEVHQDGSYYYSAPTPDDTDDSGTGDGVRKTGTGKGSEQKSFLTLQVYLNDGGGQLGAGDGKNAGKQCFVGGATRFFEEPTEATSPHKGRPSQYRLKGESTLSLEATAAAPPSIANWIVHDVVPRKGRVLLFQHNIWHEGERVRSGIKYVLRSEIMFAKSAPNEAEGGGA